MPRVKQTARRVLRLTTQQQTNLTEKAFIEHSRQARLQAIEKERRATAVQIITNPAFPTHYAEVFPRAPQPMETEPQPRQETDDGGNWLERLSELSEEMRTKRQRLDADDADTAATTAHNNNNNAASAVDSARVLARKAAQIAVLRRGKDAMLAAAQKIRGDNQRDRDGVQQMHGDSHREALPPTEDIVKAFFEAFEQERVLFMRELEKIHMSETEQRDFVVDWLHEIRKRPEGRQ